MVGGSITNFIVLVVVVKAGVIISLFLFMNEFVKGESSMNDSVFFKSSNAKKLIKDYTLYFLINLFLTK